jgi:hypothetical protein
MLRHPPFTHWWGEPVTFLAVVHMAKRLQHDAVRGVKLKQEVLDTPGFMGFIPIQVVLRKKMAVAS